MSDSPATPTMPDLATLLAQATLPTVPEAVSKYITSELGYFSLKNSNRRTLNMSDARMAPFILASRPDLLASLTGDDLSVAVAKEFCHEIREYATDHGLSSYPKRSGCMVTFRVYKSSEKNGDSDGENDSDDSDSDSDS